MAGNSAHGGKDSRNMQNQLRKFTARHMLCAALICAAMLPATAGAQTTQKTYTLYLGANISVNLDKSIYPVRDVDGSAWVVDINGQKKVISAKQGPINLKIVPSLKLSEVSATIAGFKKEGAYTFANDPSVRLTQGLGKAATVNASYQAASNQASAIDPSFINTGGTSGTTPSGGTSAAHGESTSAAAAASASSGANASTDLMARQPDNSGYDAMSVEFEISSAKPLQDPYIVTMARFHPPGSEPGTVQSLVFAKALDPIGATPTQVKFSEEGFPINYELVDFQLHLYDGGTEIATNIAEKREAMTFDQAFDYVKTVYLESHKGETMHAVPVMGDVPAALASHLEQGKYPEIVYVRVSKDGLADTVFADSACEKKIEDSYLLSVVKDIRFKPALAQGTPVEGVASLKLSQLAN